MADDLVSCDLEGETALMSVDQGKYYGLDPHRQPHLGPPGTGPAGRGFVRPAAAEFAVEPAQCQQDVLAFLHDLAQDNLITVVDEPPA